MRWKRIILIGAAAVVLGGAGLASTLLYTYHKQTELDRSDPEVVLIRYLDATFERKDPAVAGLYTCSNPGGLAMVGAFHTDLQQREKDFGVTINVTNGTMTKSGADITTSLVVEAFKDGRRTSRWTEVWRFSMKDEDGWRVCAAERIAQPSPSQGPSPSANSSAVPTVSPSAVPSAG